MRYQIPLLLGEVGEFASRVRVLALAFLLLPLPAYAQEGAAIEFGLPLFAFIVGAGFALVYSLFLRKQQETTAQEERNHAAMLFSSSHLSFYYQNLETHKEWFSRKLKTLLDITAKPPAFRHFAEALSERDYDRLKQSVVDLKAGSEQIRLEFTLADGRTLECFGTIRLEKQVQHLILWWQDISARNKDFERIRKEHERIKQEVQHLSNTLNALPMPVWQRDQRLQIRYCNLAFMEAAEENPSSGSHEMVELHSNAKQLAQRALESHNPAKERRYIVLHGERKPFDFIEIPWGDGRYSTGVALDISEMESVREEMERITAAQTDLLESTNSAMAIYGPDQRLRFYNSAFAKLWKLEEGWLAGHPRYSEILEKLRESRSLPEQANFPAFKQQQLKMFADLITTHEEYYYLPDGRTLRALATPHTLGGVLFAYEDVTDRLALERSYNTLIAVQKETLDNLHEGVAVFGEDGRLKLSNPVYIQMWDLSPEIVLSEPHIGDILNRNKPLFKFEDWEKFKDHFLKLMESRQAQRHRLERRDSKIFEIIVVPLPDGQTLLNYVDITDSIIAERSLREKNEALQEADRLKSEFLANISYELRSPLTSISGFTEMLRQDYLGRLTERQQEYLNSIQEASQHLSSLINDILDIASIEAGYMQLNIAPFNIPKMISLLPAQVGDLARDGKVTLSIHCNPDVGMMEGDELRIRQVLVNLLSNSLKYTGAGGYVNLNVTAMNDDRILFRVEDNGIGITEEEMDFVFAKFYRTANASRIKSGTGLGLSMVKSFVELHGGEIELSSNPGTGTIISCYFPRSSKS